jgi:hypothetical protein
MSRPLLRLLAVCSCVLGGLPSCGPEAETSVGQRTSAILDEIYPSAARRIYNLEEYNSDIARHTTAPAEYSPDQRVRFFVWNRWGLFFQLAGRDLNGTGLNGFALDGHFVSSIPFDSVSLGDVPLKKIELVATMLKALPEHGGPVFGKGIVGMTFVGDLEDGSAVPLRIDNVRWNQTPGQTDLLLYDVSYQTELGWRPLCGLGDDGSAVPAIPLAGRWDYTVRTPGSGSWVNDEAKFTFACHGFILEKCVVAGYRPWVRYLSCSHPGKGSGCKTTSLATHHQACTRLLRADFCGDGTPFTIDGTLVNMYDGVGLRSDTEDWLAEAEWDANGARCANLQRVADHMPPCLAALASADCGDPTHFATGTLLISEVEPRE